MDWNPISTLASLAKLGLCSELEFEAAGRHHHFTTFRERVILVAAAAKFFNWWLLRFESNLILIMVTRS